MHSDSSYQDSMTAQTYAGWYETPRGAWMGGAELRALCALGALRRGDALLDAGCGTGWFTRRFAEAGCAVTGLDRDAAMLAHARAQPGPPIDYVRGDLTALPFGDRRFDVAVAVTSLCFVAEQLTALRELARVSRRSVLLGLLHRHSLLHVRKRGRGAYAGAHWHTRGEIRALAAAAGFAQDRTQIETLLFWPGQARTGRVLERLAPLREFGAFLAVRLDH